MDNVAIFGVPRSGTSWLGQIFNSSPSVAYRYQPIFAYSFDGELSNESSEKEIQEFHNKLLLTEDDFVCQKQNISGNKAPQFEKRNITHLVWKEVRYLNIIENILENSTTKVVGIVRHPCGVLKSWMKAPKEFKPEWSIKKEWRYAHKKNSGTHEFYGYEQWLKASRMFKYFVENYSDQFEVIVYETLLDDIYNQTNSLFDFVKLDMTENTRRFLKTSTSQESDDPYGVYRKNKSGYDWKEELPVDIIDDILEDSRFLEIAPFYGWSV